MWRVLIGLSPAISIDQSQRIEIPFYRWTVTEIYDYFRLLYARVGIHTVRSVKRNQKQTVDQMVDQIMALPERTKFQLLAPVVRGRKGTHAKLLEQQERAVMSVC